ncbi:MAG TPA: WbuC family cupin fold metalloprotein [Geobacteraceae bacterium]|nr:WbuC family cupin fold metalloprotein [Geobacteraceae bacterium]
MIDIIDASLLDAVSAQAKESPRLRKNHNIHKSHEEPCNRLLNAVEPGSYIRPHRHLDPAKGESVVILRGRLGVIEFDDDGAVLRKNLLIPGGKEVAANVPPGVFHTFVSLETGTVFFEAKAGPYRPITEEEFAGWAPVEGSADVPAYLGKLVETW